MAKFVMRRLPDEMNAVGGRMYPQMLSTGEVSLDKMARKIADASTFTRGDVEIHTSLVDHNGYLVDFTTAFEIRCGGWTLYHTGDCGWGSERKLHTVWGRPDLWLFFPGCGIDVKKAAKRVKPKRIVFGHMWELAHEPEHRLGEAVLRPALAAAREVCADTSIGYWGERLA